MSKTRQTRNASGTVEYRAIALEDTSVDDSGKMFGLAIRFNSPTQIGDPSWGFRESFATGSLTKTLQERDVVLLDNHDVAKPIARKSAGTLRTNQTSEGLRWDADPVDTSYARDAQANIKAKNYGGCSVGFRAIKEDWLDDEGQPSDPMNGTQRIVREAELPEFSVVTFPAYGDTEVSARDAVTAAREARAAKATYDDLDTCGECGATDQYGAYCASCGEPMTPPKSSSKFCPSCGSKISGKRADHVCSESRDDSSTPGHAPFTGKHTHAHPAFDSQGADETHAHSHSHDGDNNHSHHGDGTEEKSAAPVVTVTGNDYTDMAACLITAYNALPADQRELLPSELRTAIESFTPVVPKPEVSTSEIDIRSYQLRMMKLSERV